MNNTLIFLFLFVSVSASAQDFRAKREGKKLFVIENGVIKDSIMLFRAGSARHRVVGNVLYYTDGLVTPGNIKLVLFKVTLNDRSAPKKSYPVKTFNLDYNRPLRLKLKRDRLVVVYEADGKRNKLVRAYEGLTEDLVK